MKLKTSLLFTILFVANGQQDIDLKRHLRSAQQHRKLDVTGLELIDSVTDEKVADLGEATFGGTVVSIASLPNGASNLNIRAVTSDSGPVFLEGPDGYSRTEGVAPYAYCGDSGGSFAACGTNLLPTDTPITITATAGGTSLTRTFTLSTSSTTAPSQAPTTANPTSTPSPTGTPSACGIPKFVGDWEDATEYPIPVGESQGGMIGDNFLVVSGFHNGIDASTERNWKLDTTDPNANWTPVDDIPEPQGITHGAMVVVGTKYYQCGGYLGGHPGPHIPDCIVYDDSQPPGQQWSTLPDLPAGRAGGGMVYNTLSNSLIYSGGAERPMADKAYAEDYRHTWKLDLGNIAAGWSADFALPDIPFDSNHMSYATATDSTGKERHFFVGGQMGENEKTGNNDDNYEFDAINETWIKRANMPFTRGHASSSTRAFGCGFLIMAGSTNEFGKTADVSWYDVETDSWTSIGELPSKIKTPVCDISPNGYLYCESGWKKGYFSHRRKIILEFDS